MKNIMLRISAILLIVGGLFSNPTKAQVSRLLPYPQQIEQHEGYFIPSSKVRVYADTQLREEGVALIEELFSDIKQTGKAKRADIVFLYNKDIQNKEGYTLEVGADKITINAASNAGLFYAMKTLEQLIEPTKEGVRVSRVSINDYPRFAYRGLHLDVSRHFYDVDFIKKHIDVLAHYKFNTFHWHLTDGTAWRLQIKQYPELTQKSAFRDSANWKAWWVGDRKYAIEGQPNVYGGYYTHEQVKEVLAYAKERHITVIPEIEMPGHSEEVLAVYPHLSCSGKPYTNGEFCAGNEEVFEFLENVLDEVIELFPSEYIHIGGDEVAKHHWEKCPKCQKRIKDNNLKDEEHLQSYFIQRMEKYLHSKGRKLVGWDEIIEGGLSKSATVMSWRGEEGGIKAARQGNPVIMTPGEYCYLDQYQYNPLVEPEAIGGYLPLQKVYSYDPLNIDLTEEQKKNILGIQGNVWTEYMPTIEHTERMIYPRILALGEVAWTNPSQKEWASFKTRVTRNFDYLNERGISHTPLSTIITQERTVDVENKVITVALNADVDSAVIRYTTDGSNPTNKSAQYSKPIKFTETTRLKTQLYLKGKAISDVQPFSIDVHKGLGRPIELSRYLGAYPAAGKSSLVDGKLGGYSYRDQVWQGYVRQITCTVDLGSVQTIREVRSRYMQLVGPWIWLPKSVTYYVSDDNINFTPIKEITHDIPLDTERMLFKDFTFEGEVKGRYVKMHAKAIDKVGAVMFVDELIIN